LLLQAKQLPSVCPDTAETTADVAHIGVAELTIEQKVLLVQA